MSRMIPGNDYFRMKKLHKDKEKGLGKRSIQSCLMGTVSVLQDEKVLEIGLYG